MKPGYYVYGDYTIVIVDLEGFYWWLDGDSQDTEYNVYTMNELGDPDLDFISISDYNIKNFDKSSFNDPWLKELIDIKKELFYKDIDGA